MKYTNTPAISVPRTASVWDLNPEASYHHDEQGPLRHYDQHVGW